MNSIDRATAYLSALGPAIEGSGGDQHTYEAVRSCYGFGLDEADAMGVLLSWNAACSPPWSESDLRSKVASVYRRTNLPHGYKLDEVDDEARAPRPPQYPPDAHGYLMSCYGDGSPSEVFLAWARARGFSDDDVVAAGAHTVFLDAARGSWSWPPGYDIVLPLFDHRGGVRSFRARWSRVEDDPIAGWTELRAPGPKALPPKGYDLAGLVLADVRGSRILHSGRTGHFDGGAFVADDQPSNIWIVEGEPDLLTMSVVLSRKGDRDAVLGVFSGSWTWDHAKRIPEQATVIVATHDDLQGRKYAEGITESLYGRVAAVKRYVPRSGER